MSDYSEKEVGFGHKDPSYTICFSHGVQPSYETCEMFHEEDCFRSDTDAELDDLDIKYEQLENS